MIDFGQSEMVPCKKQTKINCWLQITWLSPKNVLTELLDQFLVLVKFLESLSIHAGQVVSLGLIAVLLVS